MPQDANTAVDSSPTDDFVETSLEDLTAEQYEHWQISGELPQAKQPDPPPDTPPKKAPADAGEPKGNQEGKAKGIKARTAELEDETAEFERVLARRNDLKRQVESETGEKKATPASESKPAELKAPSRPKQDDFKTWEEFEDAKLKYAEEVADYKASIAVQEDRKVRAKEAEEAKQQEQGKQLADRWNKALDEAGKAHPDWNEKVGPVADLIGKDPRFAAGAAYLLKRELGAEVLYYLGCHPDQAEAIAQMDPLEQPAELRAIELSLKKPAAEPKRETPPGPKKHTEVPPPPTDVAGRGSGPPDPVEALKYSSSDDAGAFIEAANARDIARAQRR